MKKRTPAADEAKETSIKASSTEIAHTTLWHTIVIGGGPAGMMAAGRAAELGAKFGHKILIIEKNDTLGKKLLITGGGRCNVTNAEFDNRALLAHFKDAGKFLFSAFAQHDVKSSLDFFHNRNMPTKVEAGQRVFPTTDKAESVWQVMVDYVRETGVTVLSDTPVIGIARDSKSGEPAGVILKNKKIIHAQNIIIATGGTSRPETGSTGDAYKWLADLGHTVTQPTPSLVPLAIKDAWVKRLAGVTLTDIKLSLYQNGVKQTVAAAATALSPATKNQKQKILFTHVGVTGPTVLNMSRDVSELLKYGDVTLSLDLLPGLDYSALNTRLQELFRLHDKKKFKNSLGELIPSSMVPPVLELSGINPDTECNSVLREDRLRLITLLKGIPLQVKGLLGLDKAIISSGGIALEEVDFKTMRSRRFPNLYVVGDVLDIDRPSGGYSLQLCWTTGFVAGTNVATAATAMNTSATTTAATSINTSAAAENLKENTNKKH